LDNSSSRIVKEIDDLVIVSTDQDWVSVTELESESWVSMLSVGLEVSLSEDVSDRNFSLAVSVSTEDSVSTKSGGNDGWSWASDVLLFLGVGGAHDMDVEIV
jgi:hypothetical protein